MDQHETDASLVRVFRTDDPAVLPLATMALDTEGIPYQVKHAGRHDTFNWMMGQTPTTRPVILDVLVAADVADRARELLADLASRAPEAAATAPPVSTAQGTEPPAIHLQSGASDASLGTISEAQLQELTSRLAESGPQQYRIDDEALRELESSSADPALIDLLRTAVARSGELVIRWVVR